MKSFTGIALAFLGLATQALPAQSAGNLVEVQLTDRLDDARGYCLDIAGGRGKNAPLDKGLQAHTCYNYTGDILEDQGFDEELIGKGEFRIPYFDVCMTVPSVETGAPIMLDQCGDTDTQKFTLNDNGQLVAQADPKLCVTVSSTEKREGRGGSPIHVMRPLSLQPCEEARKSYQSWTLFEL
ncbi:ricin-type beta-trefoil lectin domain protein [uncultured Roseibium sp.]|uniref:ricin-type beta-trefoil lectin domain protein n=1 Tax=uncultured Roseibium sp. TaxID=1936171 RepID=UPI002630F654|nr:ricin-type beta-trefoil lectin domain protein [uncultured Roseibium sp.]